MDEKVNMYKMNVNGRNEYKIRRKEEEYG